MLMTGGVYLVWLLASADFHSFGTVNLHQLRFEDSDVRITRLHDLALQISSLAANFCSPLWTH